jgi:hypothetical protein
MQLCLGSDYSYSWVLYPSRTGCCLCWDILKKELCSYHQVLSWGSSFLPVWTWSCPFFIPGSPGIVCSCQHHLNQGHTAALPPDLILFPPTILFSYLPIPPNTKQPHSVIYLCVCEHRIHISIQDSEIGTLSWLCCWNIRVYLGGKGDPTGYAVLHGFKVLMWLSIVSSYLWLQHKLWDCFLSDTLAYVTLFSNSSTGPSVLHSYTWMPPSMVILTVPSGDSWPWLGDIFSLEGISPRTHLLYFVLHECALLLKGWLCTMCMSCVCGGQKRVSDIWNWRAAKALNGWTISAAPQGHTFTHMWTPETEPFVDGL